MEVKEIQLIEDRVMQIQKVSIKVSVWDRVRFLFLGDALSFKISYKLIGKYRPRFFIE